MSLKFSYDPKTDIFEIEGIKWSGAVLRAVAHDPIGSWLRIETRKDGAVGVRKVNADVTRTFDVLAGFTQKEKP